MIPREDNLRVIRLTLQKSVERPCTSCLRKVIQFFFPLALWILPLLLTFY